MFFPFFFLFLFTSVSFATNIETIKPFPSTFKTGNIEYGLYNSYIDQGSTNCQFNVGLSEMTFEEYNVWLDNLLCDKSQSNQYMCYFPCLQIQHNISIRISPMSDVQSTKLNIIFSTNGPNQPIEPQAYKNTQFWVTQDMYIPKPFLEKDLSKNETINTIPTYNSSVPTPYWKPYIPQYLSLPQFDYVHTLINKTDLLTWKCNNDYLFCEFYYPNILILLSLLLMICITLVSSNVSKNLFRKKVDEG